MKKRKKRNNLKKLSEILDIIGWAISKDGNKTKVKKSFYFQNQHKYSSPFFEFEPDALKWWNDYYAKGRRGNSSLTLYEIMHSQEGDLYYTVLDISALDEKNISGESGFLDFIGKRDKPIKKLPPVDKFYENINLLEMTNEAIKGVKQSLEDKIARILSIAQKTKNISKEDYETMILPILQKKGKKAIHEFEYLLQKYGIELEKDEELEESKYTGEIDRCEKCGNEHLTTGAEKDIEGKWHWYHKCLNPECKHIMPIKTDKNVDERYNSERLGLGIQAENKKVLVKIKLGSGGYQYRLIEVKNKKNESSVGAVAGFNSPMYDFDDVEIDNKNVKKRKKKDYLKEEYLDDYKLLK